MKHIKRFEIDVPIATSEEDYDGEFYPLIITDVGMDYASAVDGSYIAEITVDASDFATSVKFALNLTDIEALFDVLNHIRNKVLEQKTTTAKND